jgi:hypothetical protein
VWVSGQRRAHAQQCPLSLQHHTVREGRRCPWFYLPHGCRPLLKKFLWSKGESTNPTLSSMGHSCHSVAGDGCTSQGRVVPCLSAHGLCAFSPPRGLADSRVISDSGQPCSPHPPTASHVETRPSEGRSDAGTDLKK